MRALLKSMSQCISSLNTFKLTWLHWLQARRSSVRCVDKCPEATSTQGLGAPGKTPLPAFQGDMPVHHPSAGTALGLVPKITQMHQYLEENTEQQLLSFTEVMLWALKTRSTRTEGVWRWEVITGLYPHKPFPCNSNTYLLLEYCFLYHHAVWKITEEEPIKGKIFLSSTSSSPISMN